MPIASACRNLVRPVLHSFRLRGLASSGTLLALVGVCARGVGLANLPHTLNVSGVAYSVELELVVRHLGSSLSILLYHTKADLSNKKAPPFLVGLTYSQCLFCVNNTGVSYLPVLVTKFGY